MNQNIQRGNKPSSSSESNPHLPMGLYFPVLPLLPFQGVLSRQQRFSRRTHSDDPSVPLLPTPRVKATHPPLQKRSMVSALSSPASLATNRQNLLPFGDLSPSPPPTMPGTERRQIHNLFKDGVEVCLGDCQVRETSKTTYHLLHHHSCQPQVPWNRWKNKTAKTSKYNILAHIRNFNYIPFFLSSKKIQRKHNGHGGVRIFLEL